MTEMIDGQQYRLPNGETVTARRTSEGFLLEFRRRSRTPLLVDVDGRLLSRGENTGLSISDLSAPEAEAGGVEGKQEIRELREALDMVFDVHECGGQVWETLLGSIRSMHAVAMKFKTVDTANLQAAQAQKEQP